MTLGTRAVSLWTATAAIICLLSTPVSASVIEFDFAGTMYYGPSNGSHFTGRFSYDPTEATRQVSHSNLPYQSSYLLGPSSTLTVTVDSGISLTTHGDLEMGIAVYPANFGGHEESQSTHINVGVIDVADRSMPSLLLNNDSHVVLPNSSLPLVLSLSQFPMSTISLYKNPGGVNLGSGLLDSLTVVPEPNCTSLVCVMLAGALAFRRHREN